MQVFVVSSNRNYFKQGVDEVYGVFSTKENAEHYVNEKIKESRNNYLYQKNLNDFSIDEFIIDEKKNNEV